MIDGNSLVQIAPQPVVFLGLSLSAEEARQILCAEYRGPIRKGDLDAIAAPATVVIVDGVLDTEERLPRSEAQHALRRGLTLYGAASTGALLAIELEDAGMSGFGRVFEFLRRFEGDREDLVAHLYVDGEERAMTVPLINIILASQDQGTEPGRLAMLSRTLSAIPLHERQWNNIEFALKRIDLSLHPAMRNANAKADDARALLCELAMAVSEGSGGIESEC